MKRCCRAFNRDSNRINRVGKRSSKSRIYIIESIYNRIYIRNLYNLLQIRIASSWPAHQDHILISDYPAERRQMCQPHLTVFVRFQQLGKAFLGTLNASLKRVKLRKKLTLFESKEPPLRNKVLKTLIPNLARSSKMLSFVEQIPATRHERLHETDTPVFCLFPEILTPCTSLRLENPSNIKTIYAAPAANKAAKSTSRR